MWSVLRSEGEKNTFNIEGLLLQDQLFRIEVDAWMYIVFVFPFFFKKKQFIWLKNYGVWKFR